MSSLVTMRSPSGSRPGRLLTRRPGREDRVLRGSSTRSPVGWSSSSMVATRTVVAPSSVAVPRMYSTLFFVTRRIRPLCSRSTTWSRRSAMATGSPVALRRRRCRTGRPCRMRSSRSADSSIALVGMQPTWRHVPPILSGRRGRPGARAGRRGRRRSSRRCRRRGRRGRRSRGLRRARQRAWEEWVGRVMGITSRW